MVDIRLEAVATADLEAELAKRKEAEKLRTPVPLANPDFSELMNIVVEGVRRAAEEEYEDDDFRHYVWSAAMTSVYGPAYWAWRKSQTW